MMKQYMNVIQRPYRIGCVLMAAGLSTRFGENKLLYPIGGRTVLERTLDAIPHCLFDSAVAIISDAKVAAIAAKNGYLCMYNEKASGGQGTTVALGAVAMEGMDAALFCVADQPYLKQDSIRRLLESYVPGRICALSYQGRRGNPVLFPFDLFGELAALPPDETGRAVCMRRIERLCLVETSCEQELWDIDTKEDIGR